jgi:predicted nucleotidyltransferase
MYFQIINNHIFSSPITVSVLRELSHRKTGITGREAAKIIGVTHKSVLRALSALEEINLVSHEIAGRSYFFKINRDHYFYKKIIERMFKDENEYILTVYEDISHSIGKYCESIILYGSAARGEEHSGSDLDLCIIYKGNIRDIEEEVSTLRTQIFHKYGITIAPYLISLSGFKEGVLKEKPPFSNIAREGKLIYGKSIGEIIDGKKSAKKSNKLI